MSVLVGTIRLGTSTPGLPASSAMAGKYSWIGYALLGCHWLGWLMRPANMDEPPTAGCQPTNWVHEPPREGRSWTSWSQSQMGFSYSYCWKQTFIHTHTRTHRNPGMLPYAAFPIEWIGATWEGAINNATSFPGQSATWSKCGTPEWLPPSLPSPLSMHLPNIPSPLYLLFTALLISLLFISCNILFILLSAHWRKIRTSPLTQTPPGSGRTVMLKFVFFCSSHMVPPRLTLHCVNVTVLRKDIYLSIIWALQKWWEMQLGWIKLWFYAVYSHTVGKYY